MQNKFSEYIPLVVFTALITISAGFAIGAVLTILKTGNTEIVRFELLASFILGVISVLTSFVHISQKERSVAALKGITHSWLSKEILFVSGFVFLLFVLNLVYYAKYDGKIIIDVLLVLTLLFSFLSTLSIGMVYNLSSQETWKGMQNIFSMSVTSLIFGFLILGENFNNSIFYFVIWLIIIIDILLYIIRYKKFSFYKKNLSQFNFPELLSKLSWVYPARAVLSLFFIAAFLFRGLNISLLILGIIIFTDRFTLYMGTVQITPHKEIMLEREKRMIRV